MNLPHGIITDSRGRVLVAIARISAFRFSIKKEGFFYNAEILVNRALDIRNDLLYVADGDNPKVLLASLKDEKSLPRPTRIGVDGAGKVYVGSVRGHT